jgi:CheY-like chemotaxis protein
MKNGLKEKTPVVVADRQDTFVDLDETTTATHPILIISDNPDMLKVMACTLEDAGYTVVAVTSVYEAEQWIQAAGAVGELPALILFDLASPGKSGAQVEEALHQLGGEPIIVTSAMRSTLLRG